MHSLGNERYQKWIKEHATPNMEQGEIRMVAVLMRNMRTNAPVPA